MWLNGIKASYKQSGVLNSTVRKIIHKWKETQTVSNLQRRGSLSKFTPRSDHTIQRKVVKHLSYTSAMLKFMASSSSFTSSWSPGWSLLNKRNVAAELWSAESHPKEQTENGKMSFRENRLNWRCLGIKAQHQVWRNPNTAYQQTPQTNCQARCSRGYDYSLFCNHRMWACCHHCAKYKLLFIRRYSAVKCIAFLTNKWISF